jgi:prepilin signal peptidase PulO-like enzyme (type II secretory pathway)
LLLGKCRKCKARIDMKHLISELILGIGFGVVSALNLSFFDSVIAYITIASLGFNSVMDLNQHKMEAITNYVAMLIIGYLRIKQYWNTDVLTIYSIIFVLLYLTFVIFYVAFEGKVGFGDFEALMLVLLSCGYWNGIYVLFYSAIISIFYIAPMLILKKIELKQALPLLPFMYLGYLTNLILM